MNWKWHFIKLLTTSFQHSFNWSMMEPYYWCHPLLKWAKVALSSFLNLRKKVAMVLKGSSDNICAWEVADFVSLFLLFSRWYLYSNFRTWWYIYFRTIWCNLYLHVLISGEKTAVLDYIFRLLVIAFTIFCDRAKLKNVLRG